MYINTHQQRLLLTMYNSLVDLELNPLSESVYVQDLYNWCYPKKNLDPSTFWDQLEGLEGMKLISRTSVSHFCLTPRSLECIRRITPKAPTRLSNPVSGGILRG